EHGRQQAKMSHGNSPGGFVPDRTIVKECARGRAVTRSDFVIWRTRILGSTCRERPRRKALGGRNGTNAVAMLQQCGTATAGWTSPSGFKRVQGPAQRVSDRVAGHDDRRDREAGKQRRPRGGEQLVAAFGQHL